MDGWQWLPAALGLPDLNYLLVNAPDSYHGGFAWYDLEGDSGPGVLRSRRLLMNLLETREAAGFPAASMALLGFSQGCVMTVDAGFRYPRRLAGLVGISGYVWDPGSLLRERSSASAALRMLFTHGTQDPLISCGEVRDQVAALRAAGLDIEWREFHKAHTVAGEAELSVIRGFLRSCFQQAVPRASPPGIVSPQPPDRPTLPL